jgi:uncharacterized protein
MKLLIDIGHPGHVHYFRNFIKLMESKGHLFQVVARDKEVTNQLLNYYQISFITRGKGGKGIFGKIVYILVADIRILKIAFRFKPDIFISFSSTYAGHVAFLLGKPHILFDDTEHAKFEHFMYKPFASLILTPFCFYKSLGKKQIFFNGFMELCYLHKNYFIPDDGVLKLLQVERNEKYVIIRFVSWEAGHDMGYHGFNYSSKLLLVSELRKYARIIISSESQLPGELEHYRMNIPPERLHDALNFAALYIGEGGTTASEASILGTPGIYVNSLPLMGYLNEEEKAGLLFHIKDFNQVIKKAVEILTGDNRGLKYQLNREELLLNKIDVTAFMVWLIENYPESKRIVQNDNEYQYRFK